MRLRSDLRLWQRIYLRLTKPFDDRKIAQYVEDFSDGDTEYAEYVELQIKKTRGKQYSNMRFRTDVYADLIVKHCVDLPPNAKILSLGTRNHFELDALKDRGLTNVTGLDVWPTDSRIMKGDMHELPFDADQFDLIFASHVFEHAYDFEKVAQQCVRVLKKNGYLFCAIPVDYEVGTMDRLDFGTFENFVSHFPSEPVPEKIMSQTATHSADIDELQIILKFND